PEQPATAADEEAAAHSTGQGPTQASAETSGETAEAVSEGEPRTVGWYTTGPVTEGTIKAAINHLVDPGILRGVVVNGVDDCIPVLEVPVSYDATLTSGVFLLLFD